MNDDSYRRRQLFLAFLLVLRCVTSQAQQSASALAFTHENVAYGERPNQVFGFWAADVNRPAPLVLNC